MARADVISKLYAKRGSALDFNYDSLVAPPIYSMINPHDLDYMYKIVTSIKYTGNIDFKEAEIKKVMEHNGFKRFASGTHRVVYKSLDYPKVVAKISLNKSSLNDNIKEMYNQAYLKPFCCKCFDVQHNGLIGTFERVDPILSREEFESIASDIFDFLNTKIMGKYIVDDIGTASFMNYGIRKVGPYNNIPFGPVVLDYVEVYPLDGNKLFCNKVDMRTGLFCGGPLDFDDGFNVIYCKKCGCTYSARDLQRMEDNHEIIKKGESTNMKVLIKRGDQVIKVVDSNSMPTDTIEPPTKKRGSGLTLGQGVKGRKPPKKVALPKKDKYARQQQQYKPAPADSTGKEETTEVKYINATDTIVPTDTAEVKPVVEERTPEYDTKSKFIPEPEEEAPTPEEELGEEPADDTGEEGYEADPEDELGGEEYPAEEELGGEAEPLNIDPAAIAASMMSGGQKNPFTGQ